MENEFYNDKRRYVKYKTAAKRYDVCLPTLEKQAKEAGAICKIGRAVLIDCEAIDKYIELFRLPAKYQQRTEFRYKGYFQSTGDKQSECQLKQLL